MKKIFIVFFVFSVVLFADNIHMKNGSVYFNVLITKKTDYAVIFNYNGAKTAVDIKDILRIEEIPFDVNVSSYFTYKGVKLTDPNPIEPFKLKSFEPETTMPNKNFLLVSALSGVLAWDYFKEASDITSMIDEFKKNGIKTENLETTRGRKVLIGIASALVCIASVIISFDTVEITATPNSLSVSYNF